MSDIHILYLEDNLLDLELVTSLLEMSDLNVKIDHAVGYAEFMETVKKKKYDLILSDYDLPSFSGFEAIGVVKNMNLESPVIIISGHLGENAAVEAMRAGAVDYVLKSRLNYDLEPAVKRGIHLVEEARKTKKARDLLRKSEKNYREFFNNMPIGLFRCDNNWKIILINQCLKKILACDTEDLSKCSIESRFTQKEDWQAFHNTISTDHVVEKFETILCGFNNQKIHVRLNAHAVENETMHAFSYEGSVEDVTELKKTEEKLLHERHLLNSFIENVPDNIYFKDIHSRFLRINKTMARYVGLKDPILAIGKSDYDFFDKEHAQEAAVDEQTVMQTRTAVSKEEKEVWKNGRISWVLSYKRPLFDNRGDLIGTFGISKDITEQKKAELKLKEQNDLMNALMDNIPDSIFFKNLKGEYIACNQAMSKHLDLNCKEEIIGRKDDSLFSKQDALAFGKEEQSLISAGIPIIGKVHQMIRPHSKADEGRWYSTTKVPVRDQDGRINGLVGISRDITAFKQAQAAFQASEEKFHTVFESSNDAVLLLNQSGVLECNNATLDMFGYNSKDSIVSKTPGDLSPENQADGQDSHEAAAACVETAYNSGISRFEWTHQRADGTCFPAEVTLTRFPMNDDVLILAMVHDITERVTALKTIQRYLDVFKNIEIGIFIFRLDNLGDDRSLRVIEMNPAAERILHIRSEEYVGQKVDAVFPNLREKGVPQLCEWVVRKKEPIELDEFRYQDDRIQTAWFSVHIFPQPDQCVSMSFEDVTKKKEMESQLHLGQKLESIGQLAAGIAHEINTPTQYVSDNTHFLKDSFKDLKDMLNVYYVLFEKARSKSEFQTLSAQIEEKIEEVDLEYLMEEIPNAIDQSLEGVDRVSKIVRAMKDFSHPGSTDQTVVDINRTIETTLTVTRNEWKYVAELKTEFDNSLPNVSCYVDEFNQVILNLVTNAAHAIDDANKAQNRQIGLIKIRTTLSTDKDFIQICIEDNGMGISKANQDKIFDPFFTTKEVGKGTGQGLAIAHNIIVNKHKGRLSFTSEVGEGTKFLIELPIA